MAVLQIEGLTKRFGPVTANSEIDLRVGAGEVVGLLGTTWEIRVVFPAAPIRPAVALRTAE